MIEARHTFDRAPTYDGDLFAHEALQNPFPHYAAIRDLAPVVRLRNPNVLAIGRYADVRKALQSPAILISGKGIGFNDFVNRPVPEPGILTSDGERHRKLRAALMQQLSPTGLRPIREMLRRMIDEQVERFTDAGTFDGIAEIARRLPLGAISKLVGLPEEDRVKMLRWAAASFNVVGVIERDGAIIPALADDLDAATEVRDYLATLDPSTLRPGSWAADQFEQVRSGGMTIGDARSSIRAFVLPSLDTTIYAMGNLLYNLARNPDQYQLLRRDSSLISSAVFEGVRLSAVVRWFSRVAVEDYVADEVFIPEGERVMLLYGSANCDPRRYTNPDAFDVTRNPVDQLGWGAGPHLCAGMNLARMEMEVLLEALVQRVARIEVDEPTLGVNRGLFGFDMLPMRMTSA
ncbi:MAG TPA: cytochrome P450 [Phenylobacterium sp.]|uniref:cytochrome P450 n=1 Tax=Phenylobacterium sp. TaxID=1871053 RepID=UPI002B4836A5|nr:cytochrome P450 [Phenylobacterium sp.]HKR90212.1 cytochrome P450 [Phenylobacterium sp.]